MVDLKRVPTKEEKAKAAHHGAEVPEARFPLSVFVESPEVEKLGLGSAEVGGEHDLVARVKVTSVSIDEDEDSEKRTSVTLTLLAGEVRSGHSNEERARKLFGGE
ncbi:hypothetical protein LCGC14_0839160 [marine sediment metagenome]|uniref:Uncharacterized protein n=1 Tax=marine sediment metagenome TaxID=412755 RepID=A0A0F9PYU9_9ZZZZ